MPVARRMLLLTHRAKTTSVELPEHGTIVIGRSQKCDVFIDDHQVSRRHAAIHVEADRLQIEDLGSHNGTFLLDSKPQTGETETGQASERQLAPNTPVPFSAEAFIQIGTALITVQTSSRLRRMQSQPGIPGFVVEDPAMRRVLELADRAAPTGLTVMLLGESGAGKEMLARYVHERSPRARRRMVSLNCGALPETLLESELFGHEKGAFTGANAAKPGLFEAADGGTLFLDEVGELTPALQVKLLRVLEDRQVMRVGALEPRSVDVRFLAATNRDLDEQVKAGKFREDLYYRLYCIALHLPPLRERPGDVIPLAERFLADLGQPLGRQPPGLSDAARKKLEAYHWPGNVRQLKNVMHRALVMCTGHEIGPEDLDLPEREARLSTPTIDDALPAREGVAAEEPEGLRQRAEDAEKRRILEVLDACAGNQTRAAETLGITRRVLMRKLDKFKIPRPRRDVSE